MLETFPPHPMALVALAMITCYLTVPILIFVHELGHAWAAIRCGRRPTVVIGKQSAMWVWRFRRFDLHFHPRLPLEYFYPLTPSREVPRESPGFCVVDHRGLSVEQIRSIYASGPHASIVAGLVLAAVAWLVADPNSLLFWIPTVGAGCAWSHGIGNLIPREIEGRMFSDGAEMMKLRGR